MDNRGNLQSDSNNWQTIYHDMAVLIGEDNALKIYNHYRGMLVNFPMKLLFKEGLENVIKAEYNGKNVNDLARKHGYSARQINRVVKNTVKIKKGEKQ